MKKLIAMILCIAMCLCLFTGCSQPAGDDQGNGDGEVYNWDFLSIIATSNPAMKPIIDFCDAVKEATDGRLVITIREPGELPFTNSEFVRAVGEGSVQMAWGLMPSIAGDLNSGAVLGLPFLIQDSEDLTKAMGVVSDTLKSELNAFGTDMLFYFNMPAQNLFGQGEPMKSFSEAKQMLIRSTGSEMADFITSINAVPVTIDNSEVSTSLARGVVDSVITAALNCYGNKWNETLDWGYMFNLQADTVLALVNQDALNALPDDIREILLDLSATYSEKAMQAIADAENSAIDELKAAGMTFVDADQAEIDAKISEFSQYWIDWADKRGGNAPETLKAVMDVLGK